ncbi:transglycosylase SLT domain-containing protein [Propionivibrio sp.]|uniref:transglycosylase SLT domain-containing protein n=1 Tax=Propionivibrio sp. TaxID=2212460 RepID=UPI003BEF836D
MTINIPIVATVEVKQTNPPAAPTSTTPPVSGGGAQPSIPGSSNPAKQTKADAALERAKEKEAAARQKVAKELEKTVADEAKAKKKEETTRQKTTENVTKEKSRDDSARREMTKKFGKASDEEVKEVRRRITELSKYNTRLRSFDGDLEKIVAGYRGTFINQKEGTKQQHALMRKLGLEQQEQQGGGGLLGMFKTAGRGIFNSTGMGGNIGTRIMGQAAESAGGMGAMGGMGMLATGGLIAGGALLAIKGIQKVAEKVGEAQDDAIGYHDLRQSLGSTTTGFEELRGAVKMFSRGLGTTDAEQLKLAKTYSASSQTFGKGSSEALAYGVSQGTQLSRGFGLDPSSGVEMLAAAKHFGNSDGTEKSNRKLALLIGDAVGKTGAFSKADDVMGAIASFMESSARTSLQTGNEGAYAGLLGSLGSLKIPGLDAKGAADIADKITSGWANPGGGTEAGKFNRLDWMQQVGGKENVRAWDVDLMGGANPFSKFGDTIQSNINKTSDKTPEGIEERARLKRILDHASPEDKEKLNLSHEYENAVKKGATEQQKLAILGSTLNLNRTETQAFKLSTDTNGGLDKQQQTMDGILNKTGTKDKFKYSQISNVAQIMTGDEKALKEFSAKARALTGPDAMTQKEASKLNKAESEKDITGQIEALVAVIGTRENKDAGEKAREAAVSLDNQFRSYAALIIPLTTAIQMGVFKLVDKAFGMTPELREAQTSLRIAEGKAKIEAGEGTDEEKAVKIREMTRDVKLDLYKEGNNTPGRKIRNAILDNTPVVGGVLGAAARTYDAYGDQEGEREINADYKTPEDKDKKEARLKRQKGDVPSMSEHDRITQSGMSRAEKKAAYAKDDADQAAAKEKAATDAASKDKAVASEASKAPAGSYVEPRKGMKLSDEESAYLAKTDQLLGAKPGTSAAQIWVESKNDEKAVSPRGAVGLGQIMPPEKKVMEGRMGRKIETRMDQLEAHRLMMQENLRKFKTNEDSQKAYNGGWVPEKWDNTETSEYTGKIANYRDKNIPEAARNANQNTKIGFDQATVNVNVNHPNGSVDQHSVPLNPRHTGTYAGAKVAES